MERAHRGGGLADVTEAVPLLEYAASKVGDDPVAAERWYRLGTAHHSRWVLGQVPGSLDAALRCLDEALRHGAADDDDLLRCHLERALVGMKAWDQNQLRPDGYASPLARVRGFVDDTQKVLAATPSAAPDLRAEVAGWLAYLELSLAPHEPRGMDLERIGDLVARGAAVEHHRADWKPLMIAAQAIVDYWTTIDRAGEGAAPSLDALARLAAEQGLPANVQPMLGLLVNVYAGNRAASHGDLRAIDTAMGAMPDADPALTAIATLITAMRDGQRGDLAAMAAGAERARRLLADQPSSLDKNMADTLLGLLNETRKLIDGHEPDLPPVSPVTGPTAAPQSGLQAIELWLAMFAARQRNDVPALRRIADACDALLESAPTVLPQTRITAATTAGLAEAAVARLDPADRAAYHRSMSRLAEAMALTGPEHKQWTHPAQQYAAGLRLADEPDRAGSRRLGRLVLRAHAWRVLLQSGTEYAMEAARGAAVDARAVADWCVDDAADDPAALDDLVAVLDAGRGLALHAATVSRTVADQLTAAGHTGLAAEWQATRGLGREFATTADGSDDALAVPDELRIRVLRALQPVDAAAGPALLEPVSVAEIQQALGATGSDALVYLVPAYDDDHGLAVVVPVTGRIGILPLPGLRIGPDSPVGGFVSGPDAGRDIGPIGGSDRPGTADPRRLDDVCRWAWSACVADLIAYAERWHHRRPARLVLVPMGLLGLVPWHAAYDGHASRRRYAVENLVLSYGVSARMLCASARHPLRAPRSALVLGDPGGDLPFAGLEARAVHRTFYPSGTYLGRSEPDDRSETDDRSGTAGRGTANDVLAWISAGNRGPSLLHLACHGRVDPARPADAHLVLADGVLPASRLLEASRLAEVELDRVFLAACTTNVTGSDHDEAITLATAFLAAGAHTVFGSLWTVPDTSTSLLMFMVHHFLTVERASPVDALHRAQLWMLDPNRRPPPRMPADLVVHCSRADVAEPVCWAAFTHLGR